ncbi:TatD family hydrolase [Oligoflexaceae bacterium]|nr:TatD family hydrolase [Oligoflexaceae bacterium]
MTSPYIDVHTHLTHEKFAEDWDLVRQQAEKAGLAHIVVNGLEPKSNRLILKWAAKYPSIWPALGIYPLDAVNGLIASDDKKLPFDVPIFDVDAEIDFIADNAQKGLVKAIGECGLDGYWLSPKTYAEQERVFQRLIDVALAHELPLIIHTRKLEKRSAEILKDRQVKKVNFHCYGGKSKWAIQWATEEGWWFSIPANARKNESFTKLLRNLPIQKILTETDAPFLAPERGERNEPRNVVGTIDYLAELRDWTVEQAKKQVYDNFIDLFR